MTTPRMITLPAHVGDFSLSPPAQTRRHRYYGSIEPSNVMNIAWATTAPAIVSPAGMLYRQDIKISQFAYDMWDIEVPYGPRVNENGEWTWDFDTTGGEVHITTSKQTVRSYVHPYAAILETEAPSYNGSIDVQGAQNDVKGIDIVIPTMKLNVQYRHPQGVVSLPFARRMMQLTGMVNSTRFLGWAPYEVLFLGAQGSDGTNTDASVSYSFAISPNASALSLDKYGLNPCSLEQWGGPNTYNLPCDTSPVTIEKEGWNVIWIRYEDETVIDTNGNYIKPSKLPRYVYIERVYDTVNLAAALGFGA